MSRFDDNDEEDDEEDDAGIEEPVAKSEGEMVLSTMSMCAFGCIAWRGDCCGVGSALSTEGETGADEAVSAESPLPPPGNPVLGCERESPEEEDDDDGEFDKGLNCDWRWRKSGDAMPANSCGGRARGPCMSNTEK